MQNLDFSQHSHRRINQLTGRTVLVSPQRSQRPWQGQMDEPDKTVGLAHDPTCYLCAGNRRISGQQNPLYQGTYVFDNDFSALQSDVPNATTTDHPLLEFERATGISRVVCFSPDHSRTLPELSLSQIAAVIETWQAQYSELSEQWRWVQIFENKGSVMGCSNPHPHGQIWASDFMPEEAALEDRRQRDYFARHGRAMLIDYAALEESLDVRVVVKTAYWLAVVPFWAAWPYEILLLPRAPHIVASFKDLAIDARFDLAIALKNIVTRYDNLFRCSFPYSMGWHGLSGQQGEHASWQLHAHFYPPLLRSSSVRKFMVGYEMLAEPQRDLTPEQAANTLRAQSDIHYREATAEAMK